MLKYAILIAVFLQLGTILERDRREKKVSACLRHLNSKTAEDVQDYYRDNGDVHYGWDDINHTSAYFSHVYLECTKDVWERSK